MTEACVVTAPDELEQCLEIRRRVFIQEQGVPEHEEIDGLDPGCTQFLVWPSARGPAAAAVGTARLWVTDEGKAKAQRVAVLKEARGAGYGHALMQALEDHARRQGHAEVILGAQLTALGFYEKRGYEAYGEVFDDAGIPHRMMRLALTA